MIDPKLFSRREFQAACLLGLPAWLLPSCKTTGGKGSKGGPVNTGGPSFIAVDAYSKKIHAQGNSVAVRPVAELATIATAIVALDWASANKSLGQMVVMDPAALQAGAGSVLGFQPGDSVSVRDLITAMVMNSDNAAAVTLAGHIGRSLGGGSPVAAFVDQMNQMALTVGAASTRFTSPGGNDAGGNANVSSAVDMARIGIRAALPAASGQQQQFARRGRY